MASLGAITFRAVPRARRGRAHGGDRIASMPVLVVENGTEGESRVRGPSQGLAVRSARGLRRALFSIACGGGDPRSPRARRVLGESGANRPQALTAQPSRWETMPQPNVARRRSSAGVPPCCTDRRRSPGLSVSISPRNDHFFLKLSMPPARHLDAGMA